MDYFQGHDVHAAAAAAAVVGVDFGAGLASLTDGYTTELNSRGSSVVLLCPKV